jgi:hypothetical protein
VLSKSLTDFQRNFSGAYKACEKNRWLDEARAYFPIKKRPDGYWTIERCRELWTSCGSIIEFSSKYGSAYNAVLKNGWKELMWNDFSHLRKPEGYWTLDNCREAWMCCESMDEFRKRFSTAYVKVSENGWLSELRKRFPASYRATSNNIIYLWKSGIRLNKKNVYKIGITSKRRGEARIKKVAECHNTNAIVLRYVEVPCASFIERKILKLVERAKELSGDGVSEMFTITTLDELNRILDYFDELVLEQLSASLPRPGILTRKCEIGLPSV